MFGDDLQTTCFDLVKLLAFERIELQIGHRVYDLYEFIKNIKQILGYGERQLRSSNV